MAGAGACETELSIRLSSWGETQPGLDQYAIKKYAEVMNFFVVFSRVRRSRLYPGRLLKMRVSLKPSRYLACTPHISLESLILV